MDWNTLYCPNEGCQYYGIPFQLGKLVKNGFNHGQPQALCKGCGGSVVLSYATAYYSLESEPAIFETAVRALAEGNSIRATGRIVQVDKDTVCAWLDRAALHCRSVALYLWSCLHVTECQLDELWGFVHTKEAHLPFAKIYCETYGDAWVWLAFAPVWRLVLAFVVGKRTQENADLLLDRVKDVTDEHIPFFTSDQLPEYDDALLHTYGVWVQPERKGLRGRYPLPRLVPTEDLLYAQVVKVREKGRVTEVKTKVIFGQPEVIAVQLANSSVSDTINTSFVERDNGAASRAARMASPKNSSGSKSNSGSPSPITISSCRITVYVNGWKRPNPRVGQELQNDGNRSRQPWRQASPIMSGQHPSCYPIASQLNSWINCQ